MKEKKELEDLMFQINHYLKKDDTIKLRTLHLTLNQKLFKYIDNYEKKQKAERKTSIGNNK